MDLFHTLQHPAGPGPHPTVLALHGWGANAHDLFGLSPHLLGGQALVICPQGPIEVPQGPPGAVGYGWFPITGGGPPDPSAMVAASFQLREFVDAAKRAYPIDPNEIYVMGFSQGGVMAYDLVLSSPAEFRALIALSSWLPGELAARIAPTPDHARLPTLVIHGEDDPMIPVQRAHESRERLEALGVHVAHAEYPMGHEINPQSLRDMVGWLDQVAAQVRSAGGSA
jgi:phospholipase/carboxylesterase